ncbi:serine hydrolase [Kineococcus sp. SYSU DK003]|uniref:serine hydrolase n=1 Tax=Kineococcus sp. SYSU DK003 TaxID=3383124 RepID=UPI003D7CCE1E
MDVSRRTVTSAGVGAAALTALGAGHGGSEDVTFWARDLLTGRRTSRGPGETRPVLTLSAGPALGLLLHDDGVPALWRRVRYSRDDLVGSSPVCAWHLQDGLTVAQLGDAALRRADATATNLLLTRAGGPAAVTAFCRGLGDDRTRLDRVAPASRSAAPWDPQDTTTAAALGRTYGALVLGRVLPPAPRGRLTALLPTSPLPGDWWLTHTAAVGRYGTGALVGVARRGRRAVLVAVTVRRGQPATYGSRPALARIVTGLLRELDRSW